MTLKKANELIARKTLTGRGSISNGANFILPEEQKEHDQDAADPLICILELERISGFKPGTVF